MKIFWNGKLLRQVYPHASRWQMFKFYFKRTMRQAKIVTAGLVVMAIAFGILREVYPNTVYAVQEKIVQVPADAPVLDRIANCESKGKQLNAKGEVIVNVNTNGTVDVGKYQINMSAGHVKEMAKLGFNPLTEEGNEAYAKYLYQNVGTGPWSSSSKCWGK